ncbi:hypothetical protein O3M35_000061 [Rhynocoris fuscipes]|uniref:Uncharacterized protein n=1 Tax=Rhynocoris fuscipes TaxID=488301 RepID=A0AAW1DKT2_9HEMI
MIKYFTTDCSWWSEITNIQSARWYIYVEFIADIVTVISAPRWIPMDYPLSTTSIHK